MDTFFAQIVSDWQVWSGVLPDVLLADVLPIPEPRIPGPLKAKLLAALAGFLILGAAMIALTWLGGKFTRRYMNSEHLKRNHPTGPQPDDWASKPLIPRDDEKPQS